ncbi:MAG: hypothetical protein M0R17_00180 [Candidatus Omnitrophica bacterium]|jgi:hypothetical protein|nr:hypothetical protein [Candidatus Omnitrophota bacterium]
MSKKYINARPLVKCLICGNEFKARKDRPNICCSLKCSVVYRNTIKHDELLKNKKVIIKPIKIKNPLICKKCGKVHLKYKFCEFSKCINCGHEYQPFKYVKNKSRFCSTKCYIEFVKKNGPLNNKKVSTKITTNCIYCGKSFAYDRYRKNVQFCSTECHYNYNNEFIKCRTCGKIFKSPKHRNKIYCSIECANKGVGKRKSKFAKNVNSFLINNFIDVECEKYLNDDNKRYSLDFCIGNVAIECYGDYWHCNPKVYDEKYYNSKVGKTASEIWEYDKNREIYIISKGYCVIIIWETEWFKNKKYRDGKTLEILNAVCKSKVINKNI